MRIVLMLLVCISLTACASTPVAAPPQLVTVTKVRYVPMPAADLLPCTVTSGPIRTGADVVDAWQHALQALAICDAQISDLKRLNTQAHP
jgi:hypothetical protein